ncbi:MAG: DNA internalization-related competence protein ComEC/Rec2 [Chloroflexota bacterium]
MTLIYLSLAWVAGIFLGARFSPPLALAAVGLSPLPLLFYLRRRRKAIILASLCIIAFLAGASRFNAGLPATGEGHIQSYNGRAKVEIEGTVNRYPEARGKTTHLYLSAIRIRGEQGWQELSGSALLFAPGYRDYDYGDRLLVKGYLETPPEFDDFDYKGYLTQQGVYSTMTYPDIDIREKGRGLPPLQWAYSLRKDLSQSLSRVLPEPPQASLAQGIVLGLRGTIPSPLKEDFSRSGTAHLLAISGLHLSIMAGILLSVGIRLFGRRRHIYIWLALGTIWLYAVITGLHPPVVRAAIMASLFLTAELLGQQRTASTALAFAAAVMIAISPQVLWTASFQLSFLAMAGLVFIFPVFRDLGRRVVTAVLGEGGAVVSVANVTVDTLSVTMGAVIAVWPVVAYYFGIISLVGPLATFLALPALPGVIIIGALTAILGLIALPVAQVVGWLAWLFLSYMILVAGGLSASPVSSTEVNSISTTFISGYYIVLAAAIWFNANRKEILDLVSGTTVSGASVSFNLSRIKVWILSPLLVVAVLVSYAAATMPDDKLRVSFLDVGEGDAILIQKGSQQVLIDGGPGRQAVSLELGSRMPFWDRNIDLLVLTHPHQDHLAGLVEVLRRYRVGQVLYTSFDGSSPVYDEWQRLLRERDIEHTVAVAGQRIDLGDGVVIKVLNPQATLLSGTESDVDNNGVVLRLDSGDISFLLAADIMREAEWELISRRADLSGTVLKVAHHGSDTSTTPEFLSVVGPGAVVISVGADNKFGHPSDEVMARLEERFAPESIYRTDRQGTINFVTDGERLWVETAR